MDKSKVGGGVPAYMLVEDNEGTVSGVQIKWEGGMICGMCT